MSRALNRFESSDWFRREILPHETLLRAWLARRLSVRSDVDDVVQESFVRILAQADVRPIRQPKAYLFTTARSVVLARSRRAHRFAEWPVADVLDDGEDVCGAVCRSEEIGLLDDAVNTLPRRCREIIVLRKIGGLSLVEVADRLGVTINTVQTQQAIGMRKLAEVLGPGLRTAG